ncbi:MAG: hypothetical protein ACR2PG_20845 [Hyphomicrobiaceae bacterium]
MVIKASKVIKAVRVLLGIQFVIAAIVSSTGCSMSLQHELGDRTGLNCVDDSPRCLNERQTALTAMVSDTSRTWIETPPTATADASGVRLFAYKKQKKNLNCRQLRIGYGEAKGARERLRTAKNPQLTPALKARSAILGDEVARELRREMKRRKCQPV